MEDRICWLRAWKRFLAFSLVELMISLITISCIAAAFTPVITKKLKKQDIALSLAQTSEIKSPCPEFGDFCELCTSKYCIKCSLNSCKDGEFVDTQTCTCKSCKNDAKLDNCLKCHKKNNDYICDQCEGGTETSKGYYLKGLDGKTYDKCQLCGTTAGKNNLCFDGIEEKSPAYCENPPDGYFCNGNKLRLCTAKFGNKCATCDDTRCKTCRDWYYMDTATGTCKNCPTACYKCKNGTSCEACQRALINSSKLCTYCAHLITRCDGCYGTEQNPICTSCDSGYYVANGGKECKACSTISNCLSCSTTGICHACKAGYYITNSGTCAACSVENCIRCESNGSKCGLCKQNYHVENNVCVPDNNEFHCSDSNFIKIGKLCITRKNMGDDISLTIPPTVTTVDTGNLCYANDGHCCWKGKTAAACNDYNGGYSACNRTVCNWSAAKEICKNFNYAGKTWRLMTMEEAKSINTKFQNYTQALGKEGLMLCFQNTGEIDSEALCNCTDGPCAGGGGGAETNRCIPAFVWVEGKGNYFGYAGPQIEYGVRGFGLGHSVRCVTEME